MKKLTKKEYLMPSIELAPYLLGKYLVRRFPDGTVRKYKITETEAYFGEEDTACHARVGKTERTKTLYEEGGIAYVYLCYGIHYMLNFVTGPKDHPEAVLIRGIEGYNGPGKLTKALKIDKTFNNLDLINSNILWIEDSEERCHYEKTPRIGIDYATEEYRNILWRFVIKDNK